MLSCYRVHSNTASPGRRPTSVCVFAPADIMEHESRKQFSYSSDGYKTMWVIWSHSVEVCQIFTWPQMCILSRFCLPDIINWLERPIDENESDSAACVSEQQLIKNYIYSMTEKRKNTDWLTQLLSRLAAVFFKSWGPSLFLNPTPRSFSCSLCVCLCVYVCSLTV